MTASLRVRQLSEFCTGGCEDRTSEREAEESLLLEAVARERLDKIQHARKGLAGGVEICKVWRLTIAP
jgi:DNA-binding TFAR19-related protein (PDSD5 family)